MELEYLKRRLLYLNKANVPVKKLVTDRHGQVASYMAEQRPDIEHNYDAWHLAKCLYFKSSSSCIFIITTRWFFTYSDFLFNVIAQERGGDIVSLY